MNLKHYFSLLVATLFLSCGSNPTLKLIDKPIFIKEKTKDSIIDYSVLIEKYLLSKRIQPTKTFNLYDNKRKIEFDNHQIKWKPNLNKGLKIFIDDYEINTIKEITINNVCGMKPDSVNFANELSEIKYYKNKELIGLVMYNNPCTGIGCNVSYQLVYNLKNHKTSYFGSYKTGDEFNLYNFNDDDNVDYLGKTYLEGGSVGIDTTLFIMFSQMNNDEFKVFKNNNKDMFWFKHIYSEAHFNLLNENFEEQWIETIIK